MSDSSPLTLFEDLRRWHAGEEDDSGWTRLVAEFRVHALRNEAARRRLADTEEVIRAAYAWAIEAQFAAVGLTPPAPELLANLLTVLDTAIPLQQLLDPDGVPEAFFFETLSLMFRALVALAES